MSAIDRLIAIRPTTVEHERSIAKYGNCYWPRETNAGITRLIPVKEGIPYVADFIFVPVADCIQGLKVPTQLIGHRDPISKRTDYERSPRRLRSEVV